MTRLDVTPCDPGANYFAHKTEIDKAIFDVLERGNYILGEEVSFFEKEFALYIGLKFGVGVGSGTEALHLALSACGVGSGDEVVTVSHTAVATVAAIELCGAKPVLIDIDPETFTLAPSRLNAAITARTKAIVPVHLYGHPADMKSIMEIAKDRRIQVVEDCAQSHGATIDGKRTGSFGDAGAFSFYPTKNLGALGDGGMVATSDPDLADKMRHLREYGWKQRYISDIPGWNTRLDEIQAAVLRIKLKYLDEENTRRTMIADTYIKGLSGTLVKVPIRRDGNLHVYHQFVIKSERRDELRSFLAQRGIGTLIHYPVPVHKQSAYNGRIGIAGGLAESEKASASVLSLPIFPELEEKKVHRVIETINQFC